MPAASGPEAVADDGLDFAALEQSLALHAPRRWIGWRLRLLVLGTLAAIAVVFLAMQMLATHPHLPSTWQLTTLGQPTLVASPREDLAAMSGRTLERIEAPGLPALAADEWLLRRTARWLVDGDQRSRWQAQQQALAAQLAQGRITLHFSDGSRLELAMPALGYAHISLLFWLAAVLALALYLIGLTVLLRRPDAGNALFALMTTAQALNLLLIGCEPWRGLGLPPALVALDPQGRMALDVLTAMAAASIYVLRPRPMRLTPLLLGAAAAIVLGWAWLARGPGVPGLWLLTQGTLVGFGLVEVAVLAWVLRKRADPALALDARMAWMVLALLVLVTLGVFATRHASGTAPAVAAASAEVWYLFFALLLLLLAFMSRPRRVLREFALLAGIGTVAGTLTLLFVAAFALGAVGALLLAAALATLLYVGARRWILARMFGGASVLSTERTFDLLYRTVREASGSPERTALLLRRLLQALFAPRELVQLPRRIEQARVLGSGRALCVPVPGADTGLALEEMLVLRFASHGQRIFTHDDAQLADRVVEQVCRALAHDRALEQGRIEERQRLAQDLHDDIGARLLTLMYKAGDPEIEDYIRHTLQDLKTLTRGLAAGTQPLSDAAAEWKADLGQRLSSAGLRLEWRLDARDDPVLGVVPWSALTRILRELVSNAIAHARASCVRVELKIDGNALVLSVSDDGQGGDPQAWSHGLGLSGIRKRARTLGGQVQWTTATPGGIRCTLRVPLPRGDGEAPEAD